MTLKYRKKGAIYIIPNVEYIRRVDEKRDAYTMHFYEIKQFGVPVPIKSGLLGFDILEIMQ